jgi:AraC-like DNA-binding protein
MPITDRFSTEHVGPSERRAFWSRIGVENRHRPVIHPDPAAFSGALLFRSYGALSVAQVTATQDAGQSWDISLQDAEHVFVQIQDAGASDVEQDGKRVRLDAGALTMLLGSRPYTISFAETRFLILKLPLPRIAARIGDPARLVSTYTAARDAELLAGFLHTIVAQDPVVRGPSWDDAVGDVLVDLVAVTYHGAAGPTASRTMGEHWQRTMRDFVDRHITDPALGAPMIARRLGVTARYVQMVFASLGTTMSAYIVERRVNLAAKLLAEGCEHVADVAFRVGFSDLSHFYRSFRRRYGASPRRYAAR